MEGDKLKLVSILFITIIIIIIIINSQVHQDHMDITIIFGVEILFNLSIHSLLRFKDKFIIDPSRLN